MVAAANPTTNKLTAEHIRDELLKCAASREYFIRTYCKIYDAPNKSWIPFDLWPEQVDVLHMTFEHQFLCVLKARQLGLTWLFIAYAVHEVLFRPIAKVLLFSRMEKLAIYLLGEERLKGMYRRLPKWMQSKVIANAATSFELANGSTIHAFPSNGGDGYTATFALIDEADLVQDLSQLLNRVQPTIDHGGKLVMLSRVDKDKPQSLFKQIYKAAKQGLNEWFSIFLPWWVHPDRNEDWYEKLCAGTLASEGSLDSVHEQYPATDTEALGSRTSDKRMMASWLNQCYEELPPLSDEVLKLAGAPAINHLKIYRLPEPGRKYVIGIDTAEGNPTSDDSALSVVDAETLEQVAELSDKLQPEVLAAYADSIGTWFNKANLMVERNNHGHAVLLWLKNFSRLKRLPGQDKKEGWNSNGPGKVLLYDTCAKVLREASTLLHSFKTMTQLQSIVGSTLRAPDGEMDDCADAYALVVVGATKRYSGFEDTW